MRDTLRGILTGLVISAFLLAPLLARASDCRPVTFRTYHAPTKYVTAPYVAPTYHHNYDYVEIVKAVPVAVAPDYFWSVRDYYRDALLADAVAYRILAAQGKAPATPAQGTEIPRGVVPQAPMPRAEEARLPAGGFPQLATTACAQCHDKVAAKGGFAWFDGGKMLPLEAQQSGDVVTAVLEGRMPKGVKWSAEQKVQFLAGFVGGK